MPDRKLHTRRSSVSAPDPFGTHITTAQSHSTITILRVEGDPPTPASDMMPSSPGRRTTHRRMPSKESEPPPRLSFAFSSFGQKRESSSSPPPSPGGSRRQATHTTHTRLSPEQLYQLAKSAVSSRPSSPVQQRRSGSPSLFRNNSRPSSPVIPTTGGGGGGSVTPATFTPLPDNIYLPFIDRPSEVAALISSHPTSKLFSLIGKTLPAHESDDIPDDPAEWSHDNLVKYMTTQDRNTDPDAHWVACIKSCVRPHSELIWERLKGALGVPPDVDILPFQRPAKIPLSESGYDSDVFVDSPVIAPRASPEIPMAPAQATIIEPLLSPPMGGTITSLANPPPLSLPAAISPHAHELSGLQEEDEEEKEEDTEATAQPEEPEYTPSQIQGIRIATMPSPVSPLPPYPYYPTPRLGLSHSFASLSSISPLVPSGAIDIPNKSPAHHDPLAGGGSFSTNMKKSASSTSLDSLTSNMSTRSAGSLFPSSFARLQKSPRVAAV